jgi:hypothetical protein
VELIFEAEPVFSYEDWTTQWKQVHNPGGGGRLAECHLREETNMKKRRGTEINKKETLK